ncbi:MAG: hypothetical protein LBK13_00100 [Spirochaetales bacterium]|nr:hypothetical protein [Spirochaetales bacterium]
MALTPLAVTEVNDEARTPATTLRAITPYPMNHISQVRHYYSQNRYPRERQLLNHSNLTL